MVMRHAYRQSAEEPQGGVRLRHGPAVARETLVFWGSAAFAAAAFAVFAPLLLLQLLGPMMDTDRERIWMLTVFCGGVMALLFGTSGMLGATSYMTVRDVKDAGSVMEAIKRQHNRRTDRGGNGPYTRNFAIWVIATGAILMAIYSALWLTLR
jgi:hypothetical protein